MEYGEGLGDVWVVERGDDDDILEKIDGWFKMFLMWF
jgi:hypothetical protein